MIDVSCEKLLTPQQVAKLPAFQRRGNSVAVSTVWRWMQKGVLTKRSGADRVKLEHVRLPAGMRSSQEAVERFVAALNSEIRGSGTSAAAVYPLGAAPDDHRGASKELDNLGLK